MNAELNLIRSADTRLQMNANVALYLPNMLMRHGLLMKVQSDGVISFHSRISGSLSCVGDAGAAALINDFK